MVSLSPDPLPLITPLPGTLLFGENDIFSIVDLPDNVSSAAISLALNAGGGIQASITVLLTPEEMDQATQKNVAYRPPGQ